MDALAFGGHFRIPIQNLPYLSIVKHVRHKRKTCNNCDVTAIRCSNCSDITNDQLGISGETGHGGVNLCIY